MCVCWPFAAADKRSFSCVVNESWRPTRGGNLSLKADAQIWNQIKFCSLQHFLLMLQFFGSASPGRSHVHLVVSFVLDHSGF